MSRALRLVLALIVTSTSMLGGCGRVASVIAPKPESPFTLEYTIDETTVDSFVASDDLDTLLAAGPFYVGAQPLPAQNTGDFDAARAAKVARTVETAKELVASCAAAKPALAALRSEYTAYLDEVYKKEKGLDELAVETLEAVALAATKQALAEQQYLALAAQETTQAFVAASRDHLAVTKSLELAGLMLADADMLASYSAVMVDGLTGSEDAAVKQATATYDAKMAGLLSDTLKALQPVAQGVSDIDLAMRQLASADHYFTLEALDYMRSETAKLDEVVATLEPREGLTQEDVEGIRVFYAAFKELNASMEQHAASIDTSGLVEVSCAPFPRFGVEAAYAQGGAEPGVNYAAGIEVLNQDASAQPPPKGWFSSGWDTVKSGFGKLKTGVGVGVDAIGLGVRNITSVGAGIYYGNSTKDIIENVMTNTKEVFDNYDKGLSGSSTFTTAGEYVEGVEKGAGEVTGGATEWTFEKILGKGRISGTAGWAVNGITRISVGMFTGMAKGIYKIADKKSSSEDVAIGLIEIGLGAIGGSKIIIKASQLPGLLKGGAEGAKAFGKIVTNLVGSAANASERKAISKALADLLVKKGLSPENAKALLATTIKSEINTAMASLLKNGRDAMIKKIRELVTSGATGAMTNFKETVRGSLKDLLKNNFSKTFSGYLEAGTTVIGANLTDYVDNLVAGGLADGVLVDLIKTALAIPPDPAQVNGTWDGTITITNVDIPKSEAKTAEEAQCEQVFKQLEGKKNPMRLKVKLSDSGKGSVTMSGGSGSGTGSATYADGAITMVIRNEGSTYTLKGTVTFKKDGGMVMSGHWRAPFQDSKIIMSGTFSATK